MDRGFKNPNDARELDAKVKEGNTEEVRSAQQMWMACLLETATHEEVLAFVDTYEPTEHDFANSIYGVYGMSEKESVAFMLDYLKMVGFGLGPDQEVTSEVVEAELAMQIGRMLLGQISQKQFCHFRDVLETRADRHGFDYYEGDIYNGCDIFDENWNFLPNDYLLEEAERVCSKISGS